MLWGYVSELEKINTGKVCRFACEAKLFLSYFHFDIQSGFDDNLLGIWPTLVQIKLTVSEKGILLQVLTRPLPSFSLLVAFRPGWHIRMWCCKEFWCVSRVWKRCCEMGSYIMRESETTQQDGQYLLLFVRRNRGSQHVSDHTMRTGLHEVAWGPGILLWDLSSEFARKRQNWQAHYRCPVLFGDQSRFTLSMYDRCEGVWRSRVWLKSCYHPAWLVLTEG